MNATPHTYRFLAPSEVQKFKTQRQRPRANEIPAKATIKVPITERVLPLAPSTRKIFDAKVLRPTPTPSATPLI